MALKKIITFVVLRNRVEIFFVWVMLLSVALCLLKINYV